MAERSAHVLIYADEKDLDTVEGLDLNEWQVIAAEDAVEAVRGRALLTVAFLGFDPHAGPGEDIIDAVMPALACTGGVLFASNDGVVWHGFALEARQ